MNIVSDRQHGVNVTERFLFREILGWDKHPLTAITIVVEIHSSLYRKYESTFNIRLKTGQVFDTV